MKTTEQAVKETLVMKAALSTAEETRYATDPEWKAKYDALIQRDREAVRLAVDKAIELGQFEAPVRIYTKKVREEVSALGYVILSIDNPAWEHTGEQVVVSISWKPDGDIDLRMPRNLAG